MKQYEVIIIGGSYAGLSAAMALGRSMRNTLIIDSGLPCNQQSGHAHNFITHDGDTPLQIAQSAKEQVLKYPTVTFLNGVAVHAERTERGFIIGTEKGERFFSLKLLIATGLKDIMPGIPGFKECWGISILHCPYCHGYEVRNKPLGLLANGEFGFEFGRMINHWSKDLTLFTNGKSTLSGEQELQLGQNNIQIVETEILAFEQENGFIRNIVFVDKSKRAVEAIFTKPDFIQLCEIPKQLGCDLTEQGLINVDEFNKTSLNGVFAAGDCTTFFRALSMAIASGTKAGAVINRELIFGGS